MNCRRDVLVAFLEDKRRGRRFCGISAIHWRIRVAPSLRDEFGPARKETKAHAAVSLYRDVLGVRIGPVNKRVRLSFPDIGLSWSEGRIPAGGGFVSVRWERDGANVRYRISVPEGFTVEAPEGDGIVREP